MLQELKDGLNRTARTENGAVTLSTTASDCLDLFATVGALRKAPDAEIVSRFMAAFAENRDLATKILFYARDVRGGLGERAVFRTVLKALAWEAPSTVIKNIPYVAKFGRYDDLLTLLDTPCEAEMLAELKRQLDADLRALTVADGTVSLLGKWLPSVNASNAQTVASAKKLAKAFGLREVEYRKTLTALRARIRIIENNLRERDYSFDYERQPSRALFKYRAAFARNDSERYYEYQDRVLKGAAHMHTAGLEPYDVIRPIFLEAYPRVYTFEQAALTPSDRRALDVSWQSLPDFAGEGDTLVVVDGSGSMYTRDHTPIAIAVSLGIYMAEHMEGEFKNHFITFSKTPRLIEIKGADIYEKVRYCMQFDEIANTDLEQVFRLLLDTALNCGMKQEDMVKRIVIVSDMEFDRCAENASLTNLENAREMFRLAGYELPKVVFWNVASRNRQQPASMNERGVELVSGATPRLFERVACGATEDCTPYRLMLDVIESERYAVISA